MAKYKHVIFNSLSQLDFYQTVALPWQKLNWLGKLTVKAYVLYICQRWANFLLRRAKNRTWFRAETYPIIIINILLFLE